MFRRNLVRFREQKKMSQRSLAAAAKVSLASLQQWECGLREPALRTLRQVAAALDVRLGELVAE